MSAIREDLTVEECIEFDKEFRALWDSEIEKSGKSEAMFVATRRNVAQDIYYFDQFLKFAKEKHGLEFPALVESMTVTEVDDDSC